MILENFKAVESFESSPGTGVEGHPIKDRSVSAAPGAADAAGVSDVEKRSRKVLLGTRLVFVDDLGRPIIIS